VLEEIARKGNPISARINEGSEVMKMYRKVDVVLNNSKITSVV